MAAAATEMDQAEAIVGTIHLGRRHPRLVRSLTAAVAKGLQVDPETLPRRKRNRDHRPLTPQELAFQDRLKADRDVLATKLKLDATLIANRSQLAQIAREPAKLKELLLPWQCELITALPSFIQETAAG
jgi:ribonuclease D